MSICLYLQFYAVLIFQTEPEILKKELVYEYLLPYQYVNCYENENTVIYQVGLVLSLKRFNFLDKHIMWAAVAVGGHITE